MAQLLRQYGCGPIRFVGTGNAFYERHRVFDNVIEGTTATARERFEAVAHAVRDVLAQGWVQTEQTYERDNPKCVYYLSMEFLIGRSLANVVVQPWRGLYLASALLAREIGATLPVLARDVDGVYRDWRPPGPVAPPHHGPGAGGVSVLPNQGSAQRASSPWCPRG